MVFSEFDDVSSSSLSNPSSPDLSPSDSTHTAATDSPCSLCSPSDLPTSVVTTDHTTTPSPPLQQPTTAGSPSSADDLTLSSNLPSAPAAHHNTHPMITRLKDGIVKPRHIVDLAILHQSPLHQLLFASKEPRGYTTAAKNPRWLSTMEDEMRALRLNHT
uniref:Uncharacterized protein n=1 Tax=Lactuca sativa TaxID=4236 RepID=A0A9R1W8Y5_LACSA|nr:hypothetical protein LSAT_V11C200062150 [Lactuca sativa]